LTTFRSPAAVASLVAMLSLAVPASSEVASDEVEREMSTLAEMSIADLLQVKLKVPAAITKLSQAESPASVTVITAEDIRHTPARNIYDLIEVYVPGAFWMNNEWGPVLGIRGSIVNRNYKYLLRVNGRTLNNKAHFGANSELEQWELGDIQKIEIVRGPGSVTYGPGAVAGIINIITHDASSAEGLRASTKYVHKYDSVGGSASYGYRGDGFDVYAFGSATRTYGYKDPDHFLVTKPNDAGDFEWGYIGEDVFFGDPNTEPLDYFGDYQDNPQVKAHFDASFLENWRFWARYTQQGSNWRGNEVKTDFGGGMLNQQGMRDRQWTATLQYDNQLHEDLSVSAMLSGDSMDTERRIGKVRHPDPNHVLNMKVNFSETEIFARGLLNWQAADWAEIALGTEYSWDRFGPGWGDGKKDMRLGENGIIVSGPSSNAIDPTSGGSANKDGNALFVGDGWSTHTFSLFTEANVTLQPWLKILLSGRADKNTYTDYLFSPRVALISNFAEGHYLKLIAQRSVRMNTAGQLFADDRNDNDSDAEKLTSVELTYSAYPGDPLSLNFSGFWNDVEVIAFQGDLNVTRHVGDLQLIGLEPEISYRWSFGRVGANYSWVKQLDWNLASDLPSSGISYSDYNQPLKNAPLGCGAPPAVPCATQRGVGNDLNNWPNQAVKLFGRVALFDRLTLHVDARFMWDFQGAKDGLKGLRQALPGNAAVEEALRAVNDVDTFELDFRFDASLSYALCEGLEAQFFVQNLFGANRKKRYAYDGGNGDPSPRKVRFIEEPRTFGLRIDYRY
jgi:outer membrane receptor protein involved in Fe transport